MHRLRSLTVSSVLFVALAVLTPAASAASGDVTITGSGWGHGIGLSQYGAYGQAQEGWSYQSILGHYYTGTTTSTLADGERLWVGITQEVYQLDLTVWAIRSNAVDVTVTRDGEELVLESGPAAGAEGDRLVIEAVPGSNPVNCTVTRYPLGGSPGAGDTLAAGECAVDLEWDGDEADPTSRVEIDKVWLTADLTTAGERCLFTDWNASPSVERACSYSRGLMHIRPDNNTEAFDISVEVDLDDYALGISEMPYYWGGDGIEALKAQAIAARSYAMHFANTRGEPESRTWCWCHVYDSTVDQRYVGWGHGQSEWITAVNTTQDVVVTHPSESGPIAAYYSSSSGGFTENIEDVWVSDPVAYLKSVPDHWAYNDSVDNPRDGWTDTMSVDAFAAELGFERVDSVAIRSKFESGSPETIEVTGLKSGVATVKNYDGNDFRTEFGLYSHYVTSVIGEFTLGRLEGLDRYGTAAAISQETFDPGVPVVYVATGREFAHALIAGPAAAHRDGPVLLVTESVVPTATTDEIIRLQPDEIILLGDTDDVAASVETTLSKYAPVQRISGSTRIATSVVVSQQAFASASTVFVAVHDNFPDALSGGALAGLSGGPILLTQTDTLSGMVKAELERLAPTTIVILGGNGVVSDAVEAELGNYAPSVDRLWGSDRYATAADISAHSYPADAAVAFIATGENFPDALAAAPAAAANGAPVLLVRFDSIPSAVAAELQRLRPARIVILGGPGAVSDSLEAALLAFAG